MTKKYHKKINPKYYLPVIFIVIAMAVFFTIRDSRRIKQLHIEYQKIDSNRSINSRIIDIYTEKGASFLTLSNGDKAFIKCSSNSDYAMIYFDQNINVGDSIIKSNMSDTIIIINKDKRKYFVIGKHINKN